jgi:hypothetical protein
MTDHATDIFTGTTDEAYVGDTTAQTSTMEDLTNSVLLGHGSWEPVRLIAEALEWKAFVGEYAIALSQDLVDWEFFHSCDQWTSVVIFVHTKHHRELVPLP